jgi:IclR family acetate operon transcriptional repressor
MGSRREEVARSEHTARGTLGTVRNAVLLLELLSEGPAYQQLTDLAERSQLPVATVHRLLRSLVLADLVEQDPVSSRYGLGPQLARLSHRYLERLPVVKALSPYLVELRNSTKATILVALLVRGSAVYVDRVDGEDVGGIYRMVHGTRHAYETAAGRILAAHADETQWAGVRAAADRTGVSLDPRADHDEWAAAPYVILSADGVRDHNEVAVPVFDAGGRVLAALAASGSPHAFPPPVLSEQVVPQLQRAARAAGRTLGDV